MYAAVYFVLLTTIYLMYKSSDKILSFLFIGISLSVVLYGLMNIPDRTVVFNYLKNGFIDDYPGYNYTQTVYSWLGMYDKLTYTCIVAGIAVSSVCIIMTFTGIKTADNIADIFTFLRAVLTGFLMLGATVTYSNKYIDTAYIFLPPAIKVIAIFISSLVVRKIIKICFKSE